MRHDNLKSNKWRQRAGLVTMLLVTGVVGEFMAPMQSEASGTNITIQSGPNSVNGAQVVYGTPGTIPITASTCPSTAYTRCFALGAGLFGGVTVSNVPGTTAKLLIGDFTGAGGKLDVITLSGVQFKPQLANTTVKVTFTHKFDDVANSGGSAYSYGSRIGGFFQNSDGTNFNNFVKLSVNLNGSPASPDLTYVVGGAAATSNPFSLQQSPTYPASSCPAPCTPTVTTTITFVILGTDSLGLTNSADGGGADCNLTPQGPPGSTPARPCHGGANSLANKITAQLNDWNQGDLSTFPTLPAPVGQLNEACSEGCTQDPDTVNPGSITIRKHIDNCPYYSGCSYPEEFSFLITGNTFQIVTVTTNTNSNQDGETSVVLNPGTYFVQEIARPLWYLSNTNSCAPGGPGIVVQSGFTSSGICQFNNTLVGD